MRRKLLSLIVLLMTAATGAWADVTWPKEGEDGSVTKPYTISSAADWNQFCESFSTMDYDGKFVTLTANIPTTEEGGAVTKMAAETYQGNYFKGTFDGGGYTITVDLGSDWEHYTCGLFRYLDGATIKNLKVDGTVHAKGWKWRGGFAGVTYGTCTFENCTSKVTIDASTYMYNHSSGGFVGYAKGNITFTNCVFWGKLLGAYATNWGGFVGQKDNDDYKVTLNKCLFYPTQVTASATGSATFVRTDDADGVEIIGSGDNGAYCTQFLGTQQGTLASVSEPSSGIYKKTAVNVNGQECYVIATVSGIEDEYIADGSSHTLTPVLTCMGETLENDTHYTIAEGSQLTYTDAGDYSVTFNAAGSTYSGSCTVSYKVISPNGYCGDPNVDEGKNVSWLLNLSSGVLTISGTGAMANYSSLSNIPWYSNRNVITSVVIGEGVTTIGNGAFYQCNNLASVSIPASVTSIGEEAFAECGPSTGMAVAIAEGSALEAIGAKAFVFSNLESITLPGSLTSIGRNAFNYCSRLASVYVMAKTPPTLGNYAFDNNASERKIYVPAGSIGDTSTDGTYKHDWSAYENDIEAWANGSCGDGVTWEFKGTILTISKTGEGTGAMADYGEAGYQPWAAMHSDIKTIVIEDGVTRIGNYAFSMCEYVTSGVSIPASVTSIGNYSFNYCSMTSLTIPSNSSLETIGSFAFNCSGFGSVTIPASVKSIGNNAFDASPNLTITLNSNPFIGESAFYSDATVTINLTKDLVDGANWMTFYNKNYSFEADASTQVFKAALGGTTLTLTELKTDKIVNKNNAVILKSTASPIVMTLKTTDGSNDFTGNSLKGVDDPAGVTAADPSTTYVLNYKDGIGVGFYKLTSGKTLGVGKAYLNYPSSNAREFFGFDDTTGINDVRGQKEDVRGEYYDLQGRRVSQPTKGLYIVNGKKVVIK